MSVARHVYLRRVLFGRRFSAALTLLAGLRIMQLLVMSEEDFQSAGGVLPICFALTSAMTFLVFVATPLFLLGLSDIPACWLPTRARSEQGRAGRRLCGWFP